EGRDDRRVRKQDGRKPSLDLTRENPNPEVYFMASNTLFLLPGDGIGTEIMAEVEKLIAYLNGVGLTDFTYETGLVGGCAYDAHGVAISEADMEKALAADAVIFGAVGGPKWDDVPYEVRPEAGLLRLRKDLGL